PPAHSKRIDCRGSLAIHLKTTEAEELATKTRKLLPFLPPFLSSAPLSPHGCRGQEPSPVDHLRSSTFSSSSAIRLSGEPGGASPWASWKKTAASMGLGGLRCRQRWPNTYAHGPRSSDGNWSRATRHPAVVAVLNSCPCTSIVN